MRVGVPTEVKADERRVALTASGARELTDRGHEVLVEAGAGRGSGLTDDDYRSQGARIARDAQEVFDAADLVVKVKEPQPEEVARLRPGQLLFAYLHLAPDRDLTDGLVRSGATTIAYELVTDAAGRLPLLAPMSEVAGRLAAQAGAYVLTAPMRGRGVLMGGVPGTPAANVLVLGGGVVGSNASRVALGMGARVTVIDRSLDRLRELDLAFGGGLHTAYAGALQLEQLLPEADLVIGAVLVHGTRAPRLITRRQLSLMKPRAVLVDVSIDQGGCFESSRATTHSDPTYEVEGIEHYCVANMPGAVPITSTRALTNATLPYLIKLADAGAREALRSDAGLLNGLSTVAGKLASAPVATNQGRGWVEPSAALELIAS